MKYLIFAASIGLFTTSTIATESPYAGQDARGIKALSQQEIEGYLKGEGLGYAKAAELNQYPGPSHVLQLATELALTQEQIIKTQAAFDEMESKAMILGKQLVEKERELDQEFSDNSIDSHSLQVILMDIGALQTQIRFVHLSAHLTQKDLLTNEQIQQYDALRGYGTSHENKHHHSH